MSLDIATLFGDDPSNMMELLENIDTDFLKHTVSVIHGVGGSMSKLSTLYEVSSIVILYILD